MKERTLGSLLSLPVIAALLLQCQAFAGSNKKPLGETVFDRGCWSCHANKDSNIIDPNKTIAKSDKLQSIATFKKFLSAQHGLMPPWKTIVRNPKELSALYQYVLKMKTETPKQI